MSRTVSDALIKKVSVRLIPVLFVSYVLAYLDRINVGFAALKMNADIGISPYIFGLGAGVFFLSYFVFEVPSNLALAKFGARKWISRIMISWGIISACMAFVQGPTSFIIVRFLLGVAEAGFFPGVILYLTFWFPQEYRARIVAAFIVAVPVSLALGGPLSTGLLSMDGVLGLRGWQWLFILQGVPTFLFGFVFLAIMPDRPRDATWLTGEERSALQGAVDEDDGAVAANHGSDTLQAMTDPRTLALAFIWFANTTANLGLAFFLPQMLKGLGLTDMQTGIVTSVPYIFGTLGILGFGYISDKYNERRWTLFVALALTAVGLFGAGLLTGSLLTVGVVAVAAIGIYGAKPPFWPLPSTFMTGNAAAAGIALINSIGNLGGFVGPYALGWIKDSTQSYQAGLYFLAVLTLIAAALTPFVVNARFTNGQKPSTGLKRA
ncbi:MULTISPECIES: MFS transporter [Bradyrhizobium]|jgi:D-galactonate transporter|uniref:MFS transporter n=1 Tax=Bradyrhizobium TaxID=374 RepID=UPI00048663F9|nr:MULTISPECIES: MFS transporter [Bradyrhizobium]MCS3448473.1 D-galactonate transporter [Bradyrhizobium elkanii]MCS3560388.1 D-galactonate transporter [Bradyrhizobium elkanii]MCW2149769.1 D-galactonate transporter [Bradyrhizobium elkanii]MCW2360264.1 D-galactonate transporter [Bradyrhizobium elkanii]MCW2373498.1 D-galactonate transporter [Bradyrhizobium elkanii]